MKESAKMRVRHLDLARQIKNQQPLVGGLLAEVTTEYRYGDRERARTLFAALRKTMPVDMLYDVPTIVRTAASVGDLVFAEEAAAALLALWPQSPIWRDWYGPQDRAAIALARGEAAAVLTLTDAIQPRTFLSSVVPMLRGLAQLQLRNGAAAAAEFQTILDHPGVFVGEQADAHVGLARAYAMAGDTARARKAYEAFFEFWKRADPDVPLLLQAKAEYAQLGT
jgi:predicted Zn-dependent protease